MARAANGEGSIYERGGTWRAVVSLPDGKRISRTAPTKAEALQKRRELLTLREQGLLSASGRQRLDAYLDEWYEANLQHSGLRYHTLEMYTVWLDQAKHTLGHIRLQDLKPAHIQQLQGELRAGHYAAGTISRIHGLLKRALADAVRSEMIRRNPVDAVRGPKQGRHEMQVLSVEDCTKLLTATAEDERWGALWHLLLLTGCRIGEALALHWADYRDGHLTIAHTVTNDAGGVCLGPVKTLHSGRTITVNAELARSLTWHRARQKERQIRTRGWMKHGLIFPGTYGNLVPPSTARHAFYAALDAAGLDRMRLHDLRHTAATLLIHELGVPVLVVSQMLGHANVGITMEVYAHVLPGMHEDAAERMGELLKRTAR